MKSRYLHGMQDNKPVKVTAIIIIYVPQDVLILCGTELNVIKAISRS